MEGIELIAFEIISNVGEAKSCYIQAIQEAKEKNFDEANKLIEEGNKAFIEGHHAHTKLIQREAEKNDVTVNLIIMHAEDQLMAADSFKIIASEFIDLYKKI
ncbi:PTS lactose/cellobiose transporter subunit IIA [Miniphocaeibacter halophilus]|uniref:PTS lactose/cellobiose transporter subunit IIA n=1 Tax=Miniphocaeibacter halophilus TaxID=2931922 RepID=A0AC61MSC7_9FIRM|nr:PTS lactose/cellobiose transporter subunit IIA [Miniphocaeibacter halophilus]QQK08372.1 PTS lactose/cellobiose transporter subunit IIA [Miniphocaeibacter halophilus]